MVETSITAEHLVTQLEALFASGRRPTPSAAGSASQIRRPARLNGSSRMPGEYADADQRGEVWRRLRSSRVV